MNPEVQGDDDAALLARVLAAPAPVAQDGAAADAWRTLVGRHSRTLYAVARSLGLDTATSEDLVQTAWLRLLERGGQLRDGAAVGPWLCAIVRNEGLKQLTRRREVPTDTTIVDRRDDAADAVEGLISAERARALRLAFARLDPGCRQLLRLTTMDPPLSYDEVAAAIGRPRGSLGPTRRRCLDRLRSLLPAGIGEDDVEVSAAGRVVGLDVDVSRTRPRDPALGGTADLGGRP